jgi:hypothetical protein
LPFKNEYHPVSTANTIVKNKREQEEIFVDNA